MFKAIILALATVAIAAPTHGDGGNSCTAKGGQIKCCNSDTAKKVTSHGLLSGLDLQNLLGQCNDVTVPVVGVAVPIKSQCSQQTVCCGEINQNVSFYTRP